MVQYPLIRMRIARAILVRSGCTVSSKLKLQLAVKLSYLQSRRMYVVIASNLALAHLQLLTTYSTSDFLQIRHTHPIRMRIRGYCTTVEKSKVLL